MSIDSSRISVSSVDKNCLTKGCGRQARSPFLIVRGYSVEYTLIKPARVNVPTKWQQIAGVLYGVRRNQSEDLLFSLKSAFITP
jgi:hypothetical protein